MTKLQEINEFLAHYEGSEYQPEYLGYIRLLLSIADPAQKLASFGFESSEIYGHGDADEVKAWQSAQDELYAALRELNTD